MCSRHTVLNFFMFDCRRDLLAKIDVANGSNIFIYTQFTLSVWQLATPVLVTYTYTRLFFFSLSSE